MSANNKKRKLYFDSHFDIASFFGQKEDVSDFLDYLLTQSFDISTKMKEAGSEKPYPLLYNEDAYSVALDYQYLVYILAKWVAKRTEDSSSFVKVCNAFAILQSNSSRENRTKWKVDKKRFLSILLTEFIGILTNRDKHKDGTFKERKLTPWAYPSWTESLIETESEIYVLNQVLFDREQVKYYLDDYADRIENMGEFVKQYDVEQSAFGSKNVSNYLKKRNINKNYYFGITNANLHNNDDLIQVNFGV